MNDEHRGPVIPDDTTDIITRSRRQRLFAGRRLVVMVAVLLALVLIAWLLTPPKGTKAPRGQFATTGPTPVADAPARTGNMPIVLNGLGTVTPLATVTVQSQINGQIIQIAFKEGQIVKRGDPLIQIDPRPFQVALEQAQGALERDKALLANARIDLTRYQTLFTQDSVAEQQLATQKALVIQDQGTVTSDQGQIDAAKLNLIYCHIVSPIDGRVGLQQVNLGNYVTPAEPNGLVVVTQLQPITVVFALAEDQIPPIVKQLRAGTTPTVTAYDRSHTTQLATGTLETIDNQIDITTGTVKLKAIFANDDGSLFPNQFVNVDLLIDTLHGVTLIPQSAVQRGAPGTYVYVVNSDQTVSVRKVALGPGDPADVAITQGLKPGELVVVDGTDRLKDGAKVLLRESVARATPDQIQSESQVKKQGQNQHRRNNRDGSDDHGTRPASQ
jgi:membrane fusion protein, multidrug efflux system